MPKLVCKMSDAYHWSVKPNDGSSIDVGTVHADDLGVGTVQLWDVTGDPAPLQIAVDLVTPEVIHVHYEEQGDFRGEIRFAGIGILGGGTFDDHTIKFTKAPDGTITEHSCPRIERE